MSVSKAHETGADGHVPVKQTALTASRMHVLIELTSVSTGCEAAASMRSICCSMLPALNATSDAPRPACQHNSMLGKTMDCL